MTEHAPARDSDAAVAAQPQRRRFLRGVSARLLLHAAAALLPLLALGAALVALGLKEDLTSMLLLAAVVVVPAQLAACIGWPLLELTQPRRAVAAAFVGLLMAVLTHALFGPVFGLAGWLLRGGHSGGVSELRDMVAVSLTSAMMVGWASAPATALVAIAVHRRRRRELGHG